LGLFDKLRKGTQVFGPDNKPVGTIDRWDDNHVYISGKPYQRSHFDKFDNDRLFFSNEGYRSYQSLGTTGTAARSMQTEGEIRVPVMEERLGVEKRQVEMGSVDIRKEVTAEQVNVPVDVMREEVHVERVDVTDRPIAAGDMPDAFKEGTIRVPVRGEEVVAQKQAFVTGEVVIDRERTTETQTISDTVRKERVEVDENYKKHRDNFRQHFETRRQGVTGTAADTRKFEDAEPNYRTGFHAAHDDRFAGRKFEDVEPELRRTHTSSGTTGSGDDWEHLRDEIREGWERARR
jgi:uncharacterized protein (TIGR02271 family)